MLLRFVTSSIWYRRGLYLPMLAAVTVTLGLIGAIRIVGNSFESIVDREMRHYGANVILNGENYALIEDPHVLVAVQIVELKGQSVKLGITDVEALLRMNSAWMVRGHPGILMGRTLAAQLGISQGDSVAVAGHVQPIGILDSGMEFDSFVLMNGIVDKPAMIFIRCEHPEKYRDRNAVVLEEMIRSKYNFLQSIQRLMLYIALITALASISAIVNLARLDASNRRGEFGVLQALGAEAATLRKVLAAEFSILTVTAGLMGVLASIAVAGGILHFAANAAPRPDIAVVGHVFSTSIAAFAIAALIYLMESGKQNVITAISGE